jgi:hypothetical protein
MVDVASICNQRSKRLWHFSHTYVMVLMSFIWLFSYSLLYCFTSCFVCLRVDVLYIIWRYIARLLSLGLLNSMYLMCLYYLEMDMWWSNEIFQVRCTRHVSRSCWSRNVQWFCNRNGSGRVSPCTGCNYIVIVLIVALHSHLDHCHITPCMLQLGYMCTIRFVVLCTRPIVRWSEWSMRSVYDSEKQSVYSLIFITHLQ